MPRKDEGSRRHGMVALGSRIHHLSGTEHGVAGTTLIGSVIGLKVVS